MEYEFSVCIYPLDEAEAAALRERLQDVILAEVEACGGLFMGPVDIEPVPDEVEDGQETLDS